MPYTICTYVVGIPQVGGCWLSNETAYGTWEQAKARLDKLKADGLDYMRIFTLYTEYPDKDSMLKAVGA